MRYSTSAVLAALVAPLFVSAAPITKRATANEVLALSKPLSVRGFVALLKLTARTLQSLRTSSSSSRLSSTRQHLPSSRSPTSPPPASPIPLFPSSSSPSSAVTKRHTPLFWRCVHHYLCRFFSTDLRIARRARSSHSASSPSPHASSTLTACSATSPRWPRPRVWSRTWA